ncbi:MAG: hypothetical protein PVG96_13480 [Desulfobacterales bacterium]|jgi:hypothetical protein
MPIFPRKEKRAALLKHYPKAFKFYARAKTKIPSGGHAGWMDEYQWFSGKAR